MVEMFVCVCVCVDGHSHPGSWVLWSSLFFRGGKTTDFVKGLIVVFPLDRVVTLFSNNETLAPIILGVYSDDHTDGIFGPWSLRFVVKSLACASRVFGFTNSLPGNTPSGMITVHRMPRLKWTACVLWTVIQNDDIVGMACWIRGFKPLAFFPRSLGWAEDTSPGPQTPGPWPWASG